MIEFTRQAPSPEHTAAIARGLARALRSGDVLALTGDLGAGKTTFVRALARAMGAGREAPVASPTFVLVHRYPMTGASLCPDRAALLHMDAYRLTGADDLDLLGWDRILDPRTRRATAGSVLVVEWPERLGEALPTRESRANLELLATGLESRDLMFALPEDWADRSEVELLRTREVGRCAITRELVDPACPTYPFANERARDADLGRWFSGEYRISREAEPDELEGERP
jgi:tRNA threonylcarbamoyladenosine biosynthesis protein TsaE